MLRYIAEELKLQMRQPIFFGMMGMYAFFLIVPISQEVRLGLSAQSYVDVLYYWLVPYTQTHSTIILIAVLNFLTGYTVIRDVQQGMYGVLVTKLGRIRYIIAKLIIMISIAAFIIIITNLVVLIGLSQLFPLASERMTAERFSVYSGGMWLYASPISFMAWILFKKVLEAVCILTVSLVVSLWAKKRVVIMMVPLMVFVAIYFGQITNLIPKSLQLIALFSPYSYLENRLLNWSLFGYGAYLVTVTVCCLGLSSVLIYKQLKKEG